MKKKLISNDLFDCSDISCKECFLKCKNTSITPSIKNKIKFPVIGKGQHSWPSKSNKCPMCNKLMSSKDRTEQITVGMGALRKDPSEKDSWHMDKDLGGFLNICTHTHGDSKMPHLYLNVVDMSALGQADFAFCSIKCLKNFFMTIIEELERQSKKEKK